MEQSPRLALSYVMPSQSQKHVTVNETFRRLDALVQLAAGSRSETAEPASPEEGAAYILPAAASGDAWSGFDEHDVAVFQDGAWMQIAPFEGLRAWICDADELVVFDGASWTEISGGETQELFGVNTAADATNRLAVKSDAVLFSHDDVTPGSGDAQVKVNKAAAGDTASHLFQTNFSGRAELGLAGDDDFHIKVSPDGAAWTDAIVIDKDNGFVGLGGAPTSPFEIVRTSQARFVFRNTADDGVVFELDADRSAAGAGVGNIRSKWNGAEIARIRTISGDDTINKDEGDLIIETADGGVMAERLRVHQEGGVTIGAPTGGQKGPGTINAVSVYDDNAMLSCYVFDQALDGAVDAGKWDAKVPDRKILERDEDGNVVRDEPQARVHEPMRLFAARAGTKYDPLTLDGYARHWKEKRHLTSMPNEASFDPEKGMAAGEWIQRLVETAEIQAVLIETLNRRVTALETGSRRE